MRVDAFWKRKKKLRVLFRQFAYGVAISLDDMVLVKSGASIQLYINVVTGEKPREFSISAMKLGPCGPFLLEKEKSKQKKPDADRDGSATFVLTKQFLKDEIVSQLHRSKIIGILEYTKLPITAFSLAS
jgi:hypothetical protein